MNVKNPTVRDAVKSIHNSLDLLYPKSEIQSFMHLIFEHLLGFSKIDLHIHNDKNITIRQFEQINICTKQLEKFVPIQYILGVTDFYGLKMKLNQHVLIPRPETEELVDLIIRENEFQSVNILDIGTGSGCIAIALAKFIHQSKVDALDISENALDLASKNALIHEVDVRFFLADILQNNNFELLKNYHIIVSNPPYVTEKEKQFMEANVLLYEPHQALFVSDSSPLLFYEKIAAFGKKNLYPEGKIYAEINEAYGTEVKNLFLNFEYSDVGIIKDIHSKNRIVKAIL
ncbi:MAG: peptide chain release factor N(5)-glutamine methyltransferase [Bacteroidales bacterium]|nr:peptide chain release factor N(5)-glutamine methyltransferase [Bacteroidales bacterium]